MFRSGSRNLLEKINTGGFSGAEDKKATYEELAASADVKLADAMPLLFSPDPELRRAVGRLFANRKDPHILELYMAAAKGRPDAARRAALTILASLPGMALASGLGRMLEDGDVGLRKLAADSLLELPLAADTTPLLVKIIESGDSTHRLRAVSRLASVATEKQSKFFESLLADSDERIRQVAYETMLKYAGVERLDLLLSRVADEPYAIQQILVAGIQRLLPQAGPAHVDQVLALLASGSTGLRSAALKILLSLPDRGAVVRQFIAYSRQLAGWVRERALASLREFGDALLDPALALLRDPDPEVRSSALALIAGYEDPRVGDAAVALLRDPDWWLAMSAAEVVGKRKPHGAVTALSEALARPETRWAAVEALGHVGGAAAIAALTPLVSDPRVEIRIEALTALAATRDPAALALLEASAKSDPIKWVRARAIEFLEAARGGQAQTVLRAAVDALGPQAEAPAIHHLLAHARRIAASDLHVSVDSVPIARIHGAMLRLEGEPLDANQAEALLAPLLSDEQRARLAEFGQIDACFHIENDGRYRGNIFRDRKGLNGVFRLIPREPPTIAGLGLPADISEVALLHQGIVLVTGPSGCGKSTTLAALVNLINETRRTHVLMLEDPVEFVHPFKQSLINQREVGRHTHSFARALRAALREDPDVIVVGELRDTETTSLALTAAETGHLVLTTLNATTAAKAVDRIIGAFPADEQPQVRESFAGSLKLALAQALIPAKGGGRVACVEVLRSTAAVINVIRDNKTFQIPSLMQIGQSSGMKAFDDALMDLVRDGKVAPEVAYMRATAKASFESMVPAKFLEEVLA